MRGGVPGSSGSKRTGTSSLALGRKRRRASAAQWGRADPRDRMHPLRTVPRTATPTTSSHGRLGVGPTSPNPHILCSDVWHDLDTTAATPSWTPTPPPITYNGPWAAARKASDLTHPPVACLRTKGPTPPPPVHISKAMTLRPTVCQHRDRCRRSTTPHPHHNHWTRRASTPDENPATPPEFRARTYAMAGPSGANTPQMRVFTHRIPGSSGIQGFRQRSSRRSDRFSLHRPVFEPSASRSKTRSTR